MNGFENQPPMPKQRFKEVEVEKQITSNCFKAMGWFWEPWMLKLDNFESPILMETE